MSCWKQVTFNALKQLQGTQGVYVIYHHDQVVAIGHHTNLMCKLAGYLGSLSKVAQVDYGDRYLASGTSERSSIDYLKTYYAHPSECVIKYKVDADEAVATRLVKRLDPPWTRRERKRPVSRKEARKKGVKAVTSRLVDVDTQMYMEDLAEAKFTNTAIAEKLNARGMKSWSGKGWTAANVALCLDPWKLHNRDKHKGPHMEERFNPKLSYARPVDEATQSLRAMLKAS